MTTHVVAVGGGHGLSRTLQALRRIPVQPCAVVTVADDGGSSGRLRREHGVVALGDMRMALAALSGSALPGPGEGLPALMGHRFSGGSLEGHALGNLVLLALIEQRDGDVERAMEDAAEMLGCSGPVWPCTTEAVTLLAAVDGAHIQGQVAVMTTEGRHRRVWLDPAAPAAGARAVTAIEDADVVVLGPGSLFTSIIPNLLVPGIGKALRSTQARLVYVANLTSEGGETGGMDAQSHVDALLEYLPDTVSLEVLCHEGPTPQGSGSPLHSDIGGPRIVGVHRADLAEARGADRLGAHDPVRLARALGRVLAVGPA